MSLLKDAKSAFECGLSYGNYMMKKERDVLEPVKKRKQDKLGYTKWKPKMKMGGKSVE